MNIRDDLGPDEKFPDLWVRTDPGLNFRSPMPEQLLDYWNARRGQRRMPRRADIDPLDLSAHLGHLVLIDVEHGAGDFRLRYRLIGTAITQAMNRDSTGRYYDEIYDESLLASIYDSFRWIFEHRAPLRSYGQAFYPDKSIYSYEIINLPLSEDDDTVNMILGELIFHMGQEF